MELLIAGIATRALAQSAARAGYKVIAIDGFADLDLLACAARVCRTRAPGGRFASHRAAQLGRDVDAALVAYTAPFENHPASVRRLAEHRTLLGNPPNVLAAVRDPLRLASTLRRLGLPGPRVRSAPPSSRDLRWLVKPRRSGGGHGIVAWTRSPRNPARRTRSWYYQEFLAGDAGSLLFAADGRRAVLLGVTRLLSGERLFGASGFRYSGNVLSAGPESVARMEASRGLVERVTQEFGLVGVNGIDVIWRGDVPYTVEVNPRYTAAMELVERARGISIFAIHAAACAGTLPARLPPQRRGACGKAIVYARESVTVRDTSGWLADDTVRDIPTPYSRFSRGDPICTVFANARTASSCHDKLVARARAIYGELVSAGRRLA